MILLTGGSGTLGTELQKHIKCYAPSHKELDITQWITKKPNIDLIIHCAAYIDVTKAEVEKEKCFTVNVFGTMNILKAYPNTPFVYISSEYAHNPVNYYSETKLAGETAVKALNNHHLIIRTLFKAVPYPYDQAFIDKWTCGDEVTIIAPMIVKAIKEWNHKSKSIYIGTGRKTFYDIAIKSKPDIKKCYIKDFKDIVLPTDYK